MSTWESTPAASGDGSDAAAPPALPHSSTHESISLDNTTKPEGPIQLQRQQQQQQHHQLQQQQQHSPAQGFAMNQLFKGSSTRASRASLPSTSIALPETGETSERRRRHKHSVPRVAPRQLQLVFDMFADTHGNDDEKEKRIPLSGLREVVSLLQVDDLPSNEFDACVREACNAGNDAPLPPSLDYPDFLNFVAMMSRRVPAEEYSAETLFAMLSASPDEHVSGDRLAAVLESIGLHLTAEQAELMAAAAGEGGSHSGARNISFEDFNSVWSRRKSNTTDEISNRRSTVSTGDTTHLP